MTDPTIVRLGTPLAADALRPALPANGGALPSPAEAARRFEAFFLERWLTEATRPLPGSEGVLGAGAADRLAREWFVGEVARVAAERDALGVGRWLERVLPTPDPVEGGKT